MSVTPLITLNNGVEMPALGLGLLDRSAREETAGADIDSRNQTRE